MGVLSREWWIAAGQRAAYTGLAAVTGPLALLFAGEVSAGYVASFTAAAMLLSFATSLAGLPEVAGRAESWWRAILSRSAKTAGQVAVPAFVAVTVLGEIEWADLGVQVAYGVLTTLIRTLMGWLPEVPEAEQTVPSVTPD